MANVIMINMQSEKGVADYLEFPLLDDIQPQLENTYSSIGQLVGTGLSEMVNLANTITTLSGEGLTGLGEKLANGMSFPYWTYTAPIKLPLRLLFYLGADGMATGEQLMNKMNLFIERSTISRNEHGGLSVPGLSLSNIIKVSSKENPNAKSKLVDIIIPRVIQIKNAYITSITPTYSRQVTKDGYPIWGILDMQFSGLVMAIYEDNFKNVPSYERVTLQI